MSIIYFDSSALVKLLVDEDGSDFAAQLWNGCDAAASSRFAYPEVRAALAASRRNGELTHTEATAATSEWNEFWASMRPVELTAAVEQSAGQLAARHGLCGADAVHLASALAIGSSDLVVAVWDRRLHHGVTAAGIAVAPAVLG